MGGTRISRSAQGASVSVADARIGPVIQAATARRSRSSRVTPAMCGEWPPTGKLTSSPSDAGVGAAREPVSGGASGGQDGQSGRSSDPLPRLLAEHRYVNGLLSSCHCGRAPSLRLAGGRGPARQRAIRGQRGRLPEGACPPNPSRSRSSPRSTRPGTGSAPSPRSSRGWRSRAVHLTDVSVQISWQVAFCRAAVPGSGPA
jgi:hypothetical protein